MASTTILGQNDFRGTVTNASTSEGMPFVNIYLPELEIGTVSDENGNFILTSLPDGQFKIIISFVGFETYAINISIPSDSKLKVVLQPSAIEMEEIILSTPFHKLQSDNVMKVEQQKVSQLKTNGAITLAQGITQIPGVESLTTGSGIGKPVIRGLSSNRVLVYTQGIRLENQQFGDEHGIGLSDSGIESVEVIKGPASLLYGSDALGGVLYLNPERFALQNETDADLNFDYLTNTQGINTNFGVKSSTNHLRFILRGGLSQHSDYNTRDFRVTNSRFKETDIKGAIGYQKNNFLTELRYNWNGSELGIPEEIGVQETDKNPILPAQDLNNHILSSKSKLFFKNSSLDLNFGYIFNDRKEFEDEEEEDRALEGDAALHMKLKTFNYDLKYNLPELGRFETIVGLQGMFQSNENFGEEILIPDATTRDFGILATSHIHFEKIDLQLGSRFDVRNIDVDNQFDRNFNSFNAAAGIRADLNESIIARLNIATGFRAPNLAELASDGVHEGTNRYEIGNPNLKNENNVQLDLALEHQTEHIEVFVNGFFNRINNYIFVSPNGDFVDENPVYLYVQDDAKLYGGEIGFHLHPHPLDWLHFESSFEMVKGEQDNGDYLPLIPANKLNTAVRFEFENDQFKSGFGFIRLSSVFEQSNNSTFETETPGYSLLDAGIGSTVNLFGSPLSIRLTAKNLLNKNYINHLSRLKIDGIPNMGRNLSFGLTYKL
jgi:iron complex outermembrane receptor protein